MTLGRELKAAIDEQYASEFQEGGQLFDVAAADRFTTTFDYYFRGWLPKQKEAAIADLACGGGILLHFLKKRGYTNIVGVDISPEKVGISRQVTPNVTEGSVFDFLDVHTGCFDLMTALNIIEHLPKDKTLAFLNRCNLALKAGGRLILMTPNADTPFGLSMRYGDFTLETTFNPGSLAYLLKLSNFIEMESRETGPVPWGYSLLSTLRYAAWKVVRQGVRIYNCIETGGPGSNVFTRVFTISAIKKSCGEHSEFSLNGEKRHAVL